MKIQVFHLLKIMVEIDYFNQLNLYVTQLNMANGFLAVIVTYLVKD